MNHQPRDEALPIFEAFFEYYNGLPQFTRTWLTFSLLTTGLNTLDVLPSDKLIFLWHRIQSPNYELWRILTSFSWAGPGTLADFPVLLLIYSMAVTVPSYEEDPHDADRLQVTRHQSDGNQRDQIVHNWVGRRPRHRHSDCIFAIFCCAMLILITYIVVTETSLLLFLLNGIVDLPNPVLLPVFTRTLLYAIITLHSLKHPDQQHNINFFPVPGRYVPFFHVGFSVLMGYRINEIVHGVVIGMVYASLVRENERFASLIGRRRILYTPLWLIQFVGEDEGVIHENYSSFDRYPGVQLEQGANTLHHAAAIGDADFIQYKIDEVESQLARSNVPSGASTSITAAFRQKDRNGWQPIHEAARSGEIAVLQLLLEVDNVSDRSSESRTWRRRTGKLKVDVNARTNSERGVTPLRLVEDYHGADCDCAELLREIGAVSLGFGDEMDD
eukprot:scaffold150_cov151-Skeletonema_menzelii.AAC.6